MRTFCITFALEMNTLRRILLSLAMLTLGSMITFSAKKGDFVLVIDAGHGGHDAGAVGNFSREKDINLKVALEFGRLVKQNCPDVKIIYTRSTDVFIPLYKRADIANKAKADVFISIHTNSVAKGSPRTARGVETYTNGIAQSKANMAVAQRENSVIMLESDYKQRYQGFDNSPESYVIFELMQDQYMEKSVELARHIQRHLRKTGGRPDRGVHQASLAVLRLSAMPSVLVEVGFISTPDEEKYLNTDDGIRTTARCIYNGFVQYRNVHDRSAKPLPLERATVPEKPADVEPQIEKVAVPQKAEKAEEAPAQRKAEPEKKETNQPPSRNETEEPVKEVEAETDESPVFKVQILVSPTKLKSNDVKLKGEKDAEFYIEGKAYKYTIGATKDYSEIRLIHKKLKEKFPDAFIIAFSGKQRISTNEALKLIGK